MKSQLSKQFRIAGIKTDEDVQEEPELHEGLLYYLELYLRLHRHTLQPDGKRPISFLDVHQYGIIDGLYEDEIRYAYEVIYKVDDALLIAAKEQ